MFDVNHTILSGAGDLAIRRDQEIPAEFLASLRDAREDSVKRATDYHRVASIPAALAEHWLLVDGFDVYRAPAREIAARLRRHNLDAFLTTKKRI